MSEYRVDITGENSSLKGAAKDSAEALRGVGREREALGRLSKGQAQKEAADAELAEVGKRASYGKTAREKIAGAQAARKAEEEANGASAKSLMEVYAAVGLIQTGFGTHAAHVVDHERHLDASDSLRVVHDVLRVEVQHDMPA